MTQQTASTKTSSEVNGGMVNGIHMETLLGTVNAIAEEPDLGLAARCQLAVGAQVSPLEDVEHVDFEGNPLPMTTTSEAEAGFDTEQEPLVLLDVEAGTTLLIMVEHAGDTLRGYDEVKYTLEVKMQPPP